MRMPQWVKKLLRPDEHGDSVRVDEVIREAEQASEKLTAAVEQVFVDHPDPIAYLVHRQMDYKRAHRRKGEIG